VVRLHDVATGKVVCDFDVPRASGGGGIAFSPDNTRFAALAGHGILVWDIVSGSELPSLVFKSDAALNHTALDGSIVFSPDGKIIAATRFRNEQSLSGLAGQVILWNVETRTEIA